MNTAFRDHLKRPRPVFILSKSSAYDPKLTVTLVQSILLTSNRQFAHLVESFSEMRARLQNCF